MNHEEQGRFAEVLERVAEAEAEHKASTPLRLVGAVLGNLLADWVLAFLIGYRPFADGARQGVFALRGMDP